MSLTCLKRISETRYTDKVSHNQPNGFSIYGGHRNSSYIGQTSLSKKNKVPSSSRNGGPRGSGGNMNVSKDMFMNCCKNDTSVVKPSVKSTRGMLANRFRYTQRPYPHSIVQPDANIPENHSQSSHIEKLRLTNNCVSTDIYYLNQTAEQLTRSKLASCFSNDIYPNKVNNKACFSK